jgi:hypothetical protein
VQSAANQQQILGVVVADHPQLLPAPFAVALKTSRAGVCKAKKLATRGHWLLTQHRAARSLSLFSLFFPEITASEASSPAEILGCGRFGARKTAKPPLFFAVFRMKERRQSWKSRYCNDQVPNL